MKSAYLISDWYNGFANHRSSHAKNSKNGI